MFNRNITKYFLSFIIIIGTISSINLFAQNQPNTSINPIINNSESKTLETEKFTGELKRNDQNKLTITKDDQTKEFTIPTNLKVKRDTLDSSIDKLDPGDTVTIEKVKNNGNIISVESISNQTTNFAKWIVGVLTLLVITGIIAYIINKKANKSHIQTTVFTK